MTREDCIKKQADIYTDDASNYAEWSDDGGWSDANDIELIEKAFIEGAKWADSHPNEKLVYTKKELFDMGFGFDLNGNIVTPQEIEEGLKKYIKYRKNKWTEKAYEWLKKTMYIHTEHDTDVDWGTTKTIDWVTSDYDTVDEFIDGFRKALEE